MSIFTAPAAHIVSGVYQAGGGIVQANLHLSGTNPAAGLAARVNQIGSYPVPGGNPASLSYKIPYYTAPLLLGAAGAMGKLRALLGAEDAVVNAAGKAYPSVTDLRTGDPIPAPPSGLTKVPVADRVPWGPQDRGAFIKQWYDQGYSTPPGGWSEYDIHHIIPREYGGTNDFWNLTPVLRSTHQAEFNTWWMGYGG